MPNGESKRVPIIVSAPKLEEKPAKVCHRYYAPVVIPEPDPLNPKRINITPRLGNFDCIGARCTLWNDEFKECRDVTDSKSRALIAQYAFNKMNDVAIETGGS